ncbi:MAG: exodeoxyribonuclease V subunit gamma [Geobacteraceae bacterium]|nr:exodeoxyribonuclease V subunit gamma [Geobacteraceae bacterium]
MPLMIYSSNRMENLVDALAGVVGKPLSSPFTPEVIVVQSKGLQRWLAMELSRRFGVWANGDFPFPNSMVWRLFQAVLPDVPDTSPFSPGILTWRIAALLPRFLEREEFSQLQQYLAGDRDGLKLFQLSGKIADTFDQYTLFRPDMVRQWEEGRGGDWQEILWREVASAGGGKHRARIREEFHRKIADPAAAVGPVPERISLFGISSLPPYHVEVFAAISRFTEVNVFILSPTREYWADIVPAKKQAFRPPEERALLTEGNPLLASLGTLGRDFSHLLLECGEPEAGSRDLYGDPGCGSLLKAVQSDILNLRGAEQGRERLTPSPDDTSIRIHSCHSPMREMEVLFDSLLSMLDEIPGLNPRDIVVMTPDIETYAPYISAVFEGCRDPSRRIPFSIADRSLAKEGRIAPVLLKLLELPGSRLTVAQVLDILESPSVSGRFELDASQLETVRSWMEETRVRWGMDEGDRARFGLPSYRENSWRWGIDRLLLGYAMPGETGGIFNGILPCDGIEGTRAGTLGAFLQFVSRIRSCAGRLEGPRPLTAWRDEIRALLDDFFQADDESAHERAAVSSIVEAMGDLEESAGFTEPVGISVIRAWLSGLFAREVRGLGFMTGGVTFCEMLPMRSIPFRVVALVGMNDGAFPRQSRPPAFDRIAAHPRRGDRSLRDEDRYLFLESLLSARDRLHISYVGRSIRDNSEIPPSILVSDLLDYIGTAFPAPGHDPAGYLVTVHRLQAFSRDYFQEGSPLFSYSKENCDALEQRRGKPWQAAEFISAPLPPPPDEWKDIPLSRLLRFFTNPARFFLENRLGIRLEEAAEPLEEREPFHVGGLEEYQLKQELVEHALQGGDVNELFPAARCRGVLPPARHGETVFSAIAAHAAGFAESVKQRFAGHRLLPPLDFTISIGEFSLSGRLDNIRAERMVRCRCARLKAKDVVRTWIEHLVLNCLKESGYPRESVLIMEDGSRTFGCVAEPSELLSDILGLYWEGMSTPLRFFPESSLACAHKQEWNVERARKKWEKGFNGVPGEGDDPCFRLCFGEVDPFTEDFLRVSGILLTPLLRHLVED